MKVLNLYASIGGNRKLWEDVNVTAVEMEQARADYYQEKYPDDKVIVGDAHEYLLKNYKEFDFIRSSPPCPTHSNLVNSNESRFYEMGTMKYPKMSLYQEIILLKHFAPKETKRVVENVKSYYTPLIPPQERERHYFRSNFYIPRYVIPNDRNHSDITSNDEVYGFNVQGTKINNKRKALRDMVDPQLALHIFEASKRKEQDSLFTN